MCYFVEINLTRIEMQKRFGAEMPEYFRWEPMPFISAFAFPELPVIAGERPDQMVPASWGLIPAWTPHRAKAEEIRLHTLNAMAETVHQKPSFRQAFSKCRCLIPVHGFFEWHHSGKHKYPFYITRQDKDIFALAGIVDNWTDKESGEILRSFSVITTPANEVMARIHNTKKRMPAILNKEDEKAWINPTLSAEKALQFLQPFPSKLLSAYTVEKINPSKSFQGSSEEVLKPFTYPELVW
jgi:putative SOS response-associated peptidase YedK